MIFFFFFAKTGIKATRIFEFPQNSSDIEEVRYVQGLHTRAAAFYMIIFKTWLISISSSYIHKHVYSIQIWWKRCQEQHTGDTVESEAQNSGKCLKMVKCFFFPCLFFFFLDTKVGWHSGRQPKNKEPTVKQTRKGRQNSTNTENKYHTKNNKTAECLEIINKQSKRSMHTQEKGGKSQYRWNAWGRYNHNSGKQHDSR